MSKNKDILPEYDFSDGVRGKYATLYAKGTNVVVRSPDVSPFFRDSESVNEALRSLIRVASTSIKTPKGKGHAHNKQIRKISRR